MKPDNLVSDKDGNDTPPEWGLVELQGQISSPISTTLHNMTLGDMEFNDQVKQLSYRNIYIHTQAGLKMTRINTCWYTWGHFFCFLKY